MPGIRTSGSSFTASGSQAESPLTATALAIESRDGEKVLDQAIMVSCDVISIPVDVLELVRQEVRNRLPDLDTRKIFLGGTHTHTAPALRLGLFVLPADGGEHGTRAIQWAFAQTGLCDLGQCQRLGRIKT